MQVPKRKTSKSKVRIKKNSHYKRPVLNVIKCASCGAAKLSHRACPKCKK